MELSKADKEFDVSITTPEKADVYLSCSWAPDAGRDASWTLVKELDQAAIRVVGDVPDQPEQDDVRIERVMQSCTGFVVVLPYRTNTLSKTSPYIIREIRVAAELDLPVVVFHDARVRIRLDKTNHGQNIDFPSDPNEPTIAVHHKDVFGPYEYEAENGSIQAQVVGKLSSFIDFVSRKQRTYQPYSFLVARLYNDFAQAREAIKAAVENETGLPCLWSDDSRHTTNINGIREKDRLLIKHSNLVVADLTFTPENPFNYSPTRAHEVGMSVAYGRQTILCAQGPRRDPYFYASDIQMIFWDDEAHLMAQLSDTLRSKKRILGRRIYNRELGERDSQYAPKIHKNDFVLDQDGRYVAPNFYQLSQIESWIVAAGFALIMFSVAQLVQLLGYSDALDLAPIIAGIIVLVFSSDIGTTIKQTLGRYKYLRILVPVTGLILLLVWALFESGASGTNV